jgi:hypothetical protein
LSQTDVQGVGSLLENENHNEHDEIDEISQQQSKLPENFPDECVLGAF